MYVKIVLPKNVVYKNIVRALMANTKTRAEDLGVISRAPSLLSALTLVACTVAAALPIVALGNSMPTLPFIAMAAADS